MNKVLLRKANTGRRGRQCSHGSHYKDKAKFSAAFGVLAKSISIISVN